MPSLFCKRGLKMFICKEHFIHDGVFFEKGSACVHDDSAMLLEKDLIEVVADAIEEEKPVKKSKVAKE